MSMDFKEYSRLRSIARKRIERASAAGLIEYVRIPTVKEVRASSNPDQFLRQVKSILNEASTVKEIRATGKKPVVSFPDIPKKPEHKQTPEEKRARRNEQKRRSAAKRAVEKSAPNEAVGKAHVRYLKALETVTKAWKEAGIDVANWLGILSPRMAKKFVDYMDYRLSQADYKNIYAYDVFIKDFGTLVQKGYDFNDIQSDFSLFLHKQRELERGQRRTNKYGIDSEEALEAWKKFAQTR